MRVLAVFLLIAAMAHGQQLVNGKLKITTGTTSGCGDTVNFITSQLVPTYDKYKEFLDIEFVPWGRTQRNADGSLTCQFGTADCWANRLQRCALDLLKENQDLQVFYMNCEFSSPYPSYLQNSYLCVQAVGLSIVDVDYCVQSSAGDVLDAAAQAAAAAPMSVINFVPSIVFNDQIDVTLHNQARTRLESIVCFALAADPSTGVSGCTL